VFGPREKTDNDQIMTKPKLQLSETISIRGYSLMETKLKIIPTSGLPRSTKFKVVSDINV